MKKLICFILMILIIIISSVYLNINHKYNVKQDEIVNFINSNEIISKSLGYDKVVHEDIKEIMDVDNKKLVFLKVDKQIWLCEFTKGVNNKYKYERIIGTSRLFLESLIKTDKKDYFIICGYNYGNEISYRKVLLEGKEYKIKIPNNKEAFIIFEPIERSKGYAILPALELYDDKNKNITSYIYEKYTQYFKNL
ncbi:MAG: hypothetical protein RSB70_02045 [Clostridium sp.]